MPTEFLQTNAMSLLRLRIVFFAFLVALAWQRDSLAQVMVDMSTAQPEYLLTQGKVSTGDVNIYLTCPNWFPLKTGYQPLSFRVTPKKGTFRSDGTLRISFHGVGSYYDQSDRQSSIEIFLPKGASEARGEMIGNFLVAGSITTKATLNGREMKGQEAYFYSGRQVDDFPVFVISEESAQFSTKHKDALASMASTGSQYSQASDDPFDRSSVYADAKKLPTNWLAYEGSSAVYILENDLKFVSADALEALNHFVLAGGTVIINNARTFSGITPYFALNESRTVESGSASSVSSVSRNANTRAAMGARSRITLADFQPSLDPLPSTIWDKFQRETVRSLLQRNTYRPPTFWPQPPALQDLESVVLDFSKDIQDVFKAYIDWRLSGTMAMASKFYDSTAMAKNADMDAPDSIKKAADYAHGFGVVRLDPARRNEWVSNSSVASVPQTASMIQRASRLSQGIGNDFWDWLIPSVGKTPVIPFLGFVVSFVGIAVPGLMIWCNRHKRRVWLVVIMPVAATIFTLLLFAYGIVKDGFETKSRIRSLSFVDRDGNGIAWSRQTYFAAMVPREGIVLNPDTHLVPLPLKSLSEVGAFDHFEMDGKQRYIGLLPPRQQSQYSIINPVRKLSVLSRTAENDEVLGAKGILNTMQSSWNLAVFVDEARKTWIAKDTSPGARANLESIEDEAAIKELWKAYRSQKLMAPDDAPSSDQLSLNEFFSSTFQYRYGPQGGGPGNILEEEVWKEELGHVSDQNKTISLRPNTYILMLDEANYIDKCLPSAKESLSLHMIVGQWSR